MNPKLASGNNLWREKAWLAESGDGLGNTGVRLRFEDKQTYIAVGLKGTLEESDKRADGEIVLLYRKER